MNETLFSVSSMTAIAGWVGLSLAAAMPSSRLRERLLFIAGRAVPVVLSLLYAALLAAYWGSAAEGGYSSLSSVLMLFSDPGNMLAGWVHFLAFDLLIGRWIIDDTLANGRYRAPLLVVLPTTFMVGPLGLVLHLVARTLFAPRQASMAN